MPLNTYKTTERRPPIMVIHGGPGVGKTTLASKAPSPIFLQTEDGAQGMGVDAFPVATKWSHILESLTALAKEPHEFKTVVIDTLDGVERLIWQQVVEDQNKETIKTIEAIGYAKGYIFALSYWDRLIKALIWLRDNKGMRSVLLCHSVVKRFASPDMPEFDRYEPRLHQKALGLILEHADLCGFARLETLTKETEGGKTQGLATGRRILCIQDSAAYVAKNRYGLNNNLALEWTSIAAAIKDN